MNALAGFIVSGRWQALLVTTASGIVAFMLPPFSSVLNYLGAAAVALVTLHLGLMQGLQTLLAASALTLLFYQLAGIQSAVVLVLVLLLLLWFPCWLASAVLRQTLNLGHALKTATVLGISLLFMVYAVYGDPAPWWLERLQQFEAAMNEAGIATQAVSGSHMLEQLSALLTGMVLASLVLGIIASLLLARWWQSLVVHPGGFREEFFELRLGQWSGLLTLAVMLLGQFTRGTGSELLVQLAMVMLVPYLFAGLAVIHSIVSRAGRGRGWLIALYVAMAFLPQAMLLLAGGGLLDTWLDFRRRLTRNGRNT